jgi:hypothetical protein
MRDRETGGRFLLTKEQADALRAEDERLTRSHARSGLRERWLAELEAAHGVLLSDFERVREQQPHLDDAGVVRQLLDTLLEQKRDYAELADLHERRARLAAEAGMPFARDLAQARALELLHLKKAGEERVRVRGGACPACVSVDGLEIPLERALHSLRPDGAPAPCSCRWAAGSRS